MSNNSRATRIESYRDLIVWQTAAKLVVEIYEISRRFPPDERFGLTTQIRRAAVSIATNIAEGHARASRREFLPFLSIARGSTAEVETELTIAEQLGYIDANAAASAHSHADQISRMLTTLRRRLST